MTANGNGSVPDAAPAASSPVVTIGARAVGAGARPYVIAEMSANHRHDLDEAVRMIAAMRDAGADAVKLQTYTPDTLTLDCDNEHFRIGPGNPWSGRTLYELYGEAYTPWEWHEPLSRAAADAGLDFFSTPFDASAVELLERLDVPAFKIASFEVVDLPLIRRAARSGRPLVISTGMASLAEIDDAVRAAREGGAGGVVLLKCTSAYPSPPEAMNLSTIPHLARAFDVPVGLSDHTLGVAVPAAAVALGACVVEKHFTLSRAAGGPDAAFSLEPHEFRQMVDAVRDSWAAVGTVRYGAGVGAEEGSRVFRRSLFVVRDVRAGEPFTAENLRSIRPGNGLPPRFLPEVVGRTATRDVERGTPLDWSLVGGGPDAHDAVAHRSTIATRGNDG